MVMLDANMILRYLLNDNEDMAKEAERIIDTESVIVAPEVIAEVVYVLKGVYHMDRKLISSTVIDFLDLVIPQEKQVITLATKVYGENNLDFVDCILYSYNKVKGINIATFDKKLINLINNN